MAALAVTAIPALRHLREAPPSPSPPIRFTFAAPPGAELGAGGISFDAAIAADERRVAFVATTDGVAGLWLRALDADAPRLLAGTDGARLPAWKQGGGVIAFFAGARLKQIVLEDGRVHTLAEAPSPHGAAWLDDGSLVFAPSGAGPLQRLRGGVRSAASRLLPGDRGHVFPMAATGNRLVYVAVRDDGSRVVRLAGDGTTRDLTATHSHAQLVGDRLIHARDGVLVARQLDAETQAIAGRPVVLGANVAVSESGRGSFAASPRLLLMVPAAPRVRELAWFDDAGRRLETVGDPGDLWQVRLSPDDRHAAITAIDPLLMTLDVVTIDTAQPGQRQKLTLALAADSDPVWAPDGGRVIFRSMEDAVPRLFARRTHDPEAPIDALAGDGSDDTPGDWRGDTVLVTAVRQGRSSDIETLDARSGARTPIAATGFNETAPRWSPDGQWVAFVSDESGQPDIYAVRAGARIRVSFGGGTRPRWTGDGRSLFYLRGDRLVRADRSGGGFVSETVATIPGIQDFDVAHRSRRLIVIVAAATTPPLPAAVVDWPR